MEGGRSKYVETQYHGSDPELSQVKWYECDKGSIHKHLFSEVERINNQNDRKTEMIRNARLYSNQNISAYNPDMAGAPQSVIPQNRPGYNLIKSVIDTLNSRIGKSRPRPFYLTERGNQEKQMKAKRLQQFMDGFFDKEKVYQKSKLVFRDACVFKIGCLSLYEENKDLKIGYINPLELLVDETDGMYQDPECIYRVRWVKKSKLLKDYPKLSAEIKAASTSYSQSDVEVCKVVTAWKRGKDGMTACAIDTVTLYSKPYKQEKFPFVFFRYDDAFVGFWGEDLVAPLIGIQLEISKLMRMISKAVELVAVPKVFMPVQNGTPEVQLNNRIGQVIKHAPGQPPTFYTPKAMNAEVYNYLDWLIQTGYEIPGLSKMSATSEKPAGLSSGKALRTYQDIESDRFSIIAQNWDEFFLDLAERITEVASDIYSDDVSQVVPGEKFIESVPWKDISLKKDEYVLRIFSTNLLPTQPAAKLEAVRELGEMGIVKPDRMAEMLDFPDVAGFLDETNGTSNLTKYHIDLMDQKSEYNAPDPRMNPSTAYDIANGRLLDWMSNNVSQEKIELLSRYVEQLEEMLSEPTEGVIETLGRLAGDVIILGAAGKMGPTLARMARRASDAAGVRRRVIGVSRFSTAGVEARLE